MRRGGCLARDLRGIAALEFALTGALTLAAIFAIVDAGLALQQQNALDFATWSAARWAVVNGTNAATPATAATVAARFVADYARVAGAAPPVPVVTFSPDAKAGSTVTVTATQAYAPVTGFASIGSLVLTGSATLTIMN